MDVVERLTLEAAQADTMLACEHRHRYEFAASLCEGLRVIDLCCGTGYGSAILAERSAEVVGVDNDVATIETATVGVADAVDNVSFEVADAVEFLRQARVSEFDAIVCFEGLAHLPDLPAALSLVRLRAERGTRIVASVPNDRLFDADNPYHVTQFGYDEAVRAFAPFPSAIMVPQFLAEGSLICPAGAHEVDVEVTMEDREEPAYANHFIFCVGFDDAAVTRVHRGRIQANASPVFNRWSEDLKQGARALQRENARLARDRLGKAGSAAATALARSAELEHEVNHWRERARAAEDRVQELSAEVAGTVVAPPRAPQLVFVKQPDLGVKPPWLVAQDGEDPNSWESRRRRAADYVIPWIEQTFPLAGKTVLEYGCGNAAVSCAFAERAQRLIGVDIDAGWIELARKEVRERGIDNVDLELHSLETILDAVAARRGEIDVFLCYAVLEHLTLQERLAVLRLAREVVKPDGVIVVCEAPNRLIYFDHHTAQMPFFHLLPDELALEYHERSQRSDFKAAIASAAQGGPGAALDAIVRWGRGVSFHEFELVFGDLNPHVIASNYDPLLFGERPVHPDEVILARYLDRCRPDLAPVWSRYWLDLILTPQPAQHRAPFLRPWTAETVQSTDVGWTRWENLYLKRAGAGIWVDLPHPSQRLVIGAVAPDERELLLRVRPEGSEATLVAKASAPPPHASFSSFTLPAPAQRIAVEVGDECHLVFIGYDS